MDAKISIDGPSKQIKTVHGQSIEMHPKFNCHVSNITSKNIGKCITINALPVWSTAAKNRNADVQISASQSKSEMYCLN